MAYNFALIGASGYIAPRHLHAIRDTGNKILAAVDPHDAVGFLDQYGFDIEFFNDLGYFEQYLNALRRGPNEKHIHYISVCTPNYLHETHCQLALRSGAHVICEKPLVIDPAALDRLLEAETKTGKRIHTVLQLRLHPELIKLKESLEIGKKHDVLLTYVTGRGNWYNVSWKGQDEKSGGISTNLGVHLFDLVIWLFGRVQGLRIYHADERRISGFLELEHARVRWFLSTSISDLPFSAVPGSRATFRSITVDGKEIEFSEGFADLHTRVYKEMLAGQGFGIEDARASIELIHQMRNTPIAALDTLAHPKLTSGGEL